MHNSANLDGEVVIDDRKKRLKARLEEAALLGYPWVVVVGNKASRDGTVEVQRRSPASGLGVERWDASLSEVPRRILESA